MKRTDSEIQRMVLQELKWDTRVDEPAIGVAVDVGTVTLTGTVSSWAKRVAAQEAAHRVAGVVGVANNVAVKLPGGAGRTDAELARAVRHALEWNIFVPHARITSTVRDGQVTLDGEVDFWSQREEAEKSVHNLEGVRHVSNLIGIKPPKALPHDVRKWIQEALERQADREAERINIAVADDRVSLSGVVHSWAERQAIVGAARGTPGVRSVEDRLKIQPLGSKLILF